MLTLVLFVSVLHYLFLFFTCLLSKVATPYCSESMSTENSNKRRRNVGVRMPVSDSLNNVPLFVEKTISCTV